MAFFIPADLHTVYILHSEKLNRFYIGYSPNLNTRLEFHAAPEARKFTAKADDWTLYFFIECKTKNQALGIERHIKEMKSKTYIANLKRYPELSETLLIKYADC